MHARTVGRHCALCLCRLCLCGLAFFAQDANLPTPPKKIHPPTPHHHRRQWGYCMLGASSSCSPHVCTATPRRRRPTPLLLLLLVHLTIATTTAAAFLFTYPSRRLLLLRPLTHRLSTHSVRRRTHVKMKEGGGGGEWVDLQVPPHELRPEFSLNMGQCFNWRRKAGGGRWVGGWVGG